MPKLEDMLSKLREIQTDIWNKDDVNIALRLGFVIEDMEVLVKKDKAAA
jgi:hypothetical protein